MEIKESTFRSIATALKSTTEEFKSLPTDEDYTNEEILLQKYNSLLLECNETFQMRKIIIGGVLSDMHKLCERRSLQTFYRGIL